MSLSVGDSVGIIEISSIARGIQVADDCLKTADIRLKMRITCPGKLLLIMNGEIGAVKSALEHGVARGGPTVTSSVLLGNLHRDVPLALSGILEVKPDERLALGVIEAFSVIAAIRAADTAAKASEIKILDIRPAYGMGGKGLVTLTGSVGAVQAALGQVINMLQEEGELLDAVIVPAPHTDLWGQLY